MDRCVITLDSSFSLDRSDACHEDRDRIAAYLETDRPENVRLYERFGFNVIKEIHVLGLTNWLMLRAPR